jgi:hypothetical protein
LPNSSAEEAAAAWNSRAPRVATAEMVEMLARALYEAEFYESRSGPVFVSPEDERWRAWIVPARAALAALGYEVEK